MIDMLPREIEEPFVFDRIKMLPNKLRRMIEMIDMLPHMLPREIEEPFVFDRIKMLPRELTVTADDKK